MIKPILSEIMRILTYIDYPKFPMCYLFMLVYCTRSRGCYGRQNYRYRQIAEATKRG
ncbi:hypothetical protein F4826_005037 [Rahnella inusitata]|nr:hypothetical protein [Rahnella inusitata]